MTTRIIIAALASAAAFGVQAADFRPMLKAGFDLGGDTMVSVTFTNGETESVKANEGGYLGGGLAIFSDAKDWEFHITLAYKFSTIDAENGDIDWTRVPLEALAFYRYERVRFGGGLAYHLDPKIEGSGVASGVNIKFKNALGAILQVDWLITEKIGLGARYTMLEYDAEAPARGSSKANGFGLSFSWAF
jgi:hypothetical protein